MHALLAFSAMHVAHLTDCPLVGNIAYEHRGIALKGLQEAISTFSRETSDAVLAASLVLSWQATDWYVQSQFSHHPKDSSELTRQPLFLDNRRSWTQLMQGTSSVIDAMEPWKHESQFGDFIAESSTFPTAPPSPSPDHKPSQLREEDLDAFHASLVQLQKVEAHLKQARVDSKPIGQLINFFKGARKVSSMPVAQQFERLRPLRDWLFWVPVMYLQHSHVSPSALVIIAHYYTVALLMERLFPEIGTAYFGSLSIGPVEEIAHRLMSYNIAGYQGDCQAALRLMEFPIDTVNEFRHRMGWAHPVRSSSFPLFGSPTPVKEEAFEFPLGLNGSAGYLPYGANPTFTYSTENLSVITEESGPISVVSPLQLSSPFPNGQYLSIPSPSYGGYSPASTSFGDFSDASPVNYSDGEDFPPFDNLPAPTPIAPTGLNGLGVTLAPAAQPLWI
jgi:hypothetical protein